MQVAEASFGNVKAHFSEKKMHSNFPVIGPAHLHTARPRSAPTARCTPQCAMADRALALCGTRFSDKGCSVQVAKATIEKIGTYFYEII